MLYYLLLAIAFIILCLIIASTYSLYFLGKNKRVASSTAEKAEEFYQETLSEIKKWLYVALVGIVLISVYLLYLLTDGSAWQAHIMEWLNIIIRVLHITFGIAWIGASFYFVFLENALNRTDNLRDEIAGNLWAVHGGGFYYLEKYKVAPKDIPKELHWFKYEAYFTWLSGFALLFVVYYFNAKTMLIDSNVLDISAVAGVSIGISSFVAGWLIYHSLCRTSLLRNNAGFAIAGFLIAAAFAWFYCHIFAGRAAYIHFGAMLATLMAGNVFFIIIPAQKAMVKAAKEGSPLDPELGKHAGLRSLHNNYFTMPVLFVMVSNHFPSTFGNQYAWMILAAITLGTAGIKHWLNLREKGQLNVWVFPISAAILLDVAFASGPIQKQSTCKDTSLQEVQVIIQKRCVSCHSMSPTDDVFKVAPNGLMFKSPDDILKLKDKVLQRVVITKTMPLNNKTQMTEEEREAIRCWIESGR